MYTSKRRRNAKRVSTKATIQSSIKPIVRDSIISVLLIISMLSLVCHVGTSVKPSESTFDIRDTAYSTLGVDPFAEYPEIAAAWRQRSEETHPDRIGHEEFQEYYTIQSAYYSIYIDPRRCSYDQRRGIQGKWAGKYKECNEILLAYYRAELEKEREREQAARAKAQEEGKTSKMTSEEPLCECGGNTHGEDTNDEALDGEDLVSVKEERTRRQVTRSDHEPVAQRRTSAYSTQG
ncbi:hypothetical protein VMCG_10237 [Cytospora schulzeri]|uniref:J domain-containing protein n=1 Tax=Cytospora schulzeri TaxID=448051 RepID=A0A423VGT6_9PEZI|nr:hypothetical protein VMCG_10237 [Valsa malicola]